MGDGLQAEKLATGEATAAPRDSVYRKPRHDHRVSTFELPFYPFKGKLPPSARGESTPFSVGRYEVSSVRSFEFLPAHRPLQVGDCQLWASVCLHSRPWQPPRFVPSRPGCRRGPCRAGRSWSCAAAARGGRAGGSERLCPSLCPIRECGLCPEPGSNA